MAKRIKHGDYRIVDFKTNTVWFTTPYPDLAFSVMKN